MSETTPSCIASESPLAGSAATCRLESQPTWQAPAWPYEQNIRPAKRQPLTRPPPLDTPTLSKRTRAPTTARSRTVGNKATHGSCRRRMPTCEIESRIHVHSLCTTWCNPADRDNTRHFPRAGLPEAPRAHCQRSVRSLARSGKNVRTHRLVLHDAHWHLHAVTARYSIHTTPRTTRKQQHRVASSSRNCTRP